MKVKEGRAKEVTFNLKQERQDANQEGTAREKVQSVVDKFHVFVDEIRPPTVEQGQ